VEGALNAICFAAPCWVLAPEWDRWRRHNKEASGVRAGGVPDQV
jgi:hypothetical protein